MASESFSSPDKKYGPSYAEALREGLHIEPSKEEEINRIEMDFDGWHKDKYDLSVPVTLPDGRQVPKVPAADVWLVRDVLFIGRVSVRQRLNENLEKYGGHIGYAVRASERRKGYGGLLMKEGLRVARTFGLKKVLLTCNDDNMASIRLIEKAGGVLQDKISVLNRPVLHRRYWIQL